MRSPLIFLIMLRTEHSRILIRIVKGQACPVTKDTFMKIQGNPKTPQKLNLKNIGQHFRIQTSFHQFQRLFHKSKECRICHPILHTGIRQRYDIGRIGQPKNVTLNLLKGLNLMNIINITQTLFIQFDTVICQGQGLNPSCQLGPAGMFDQEHPLPSPFGENLDQLIIFAKVSIIEDQAPCF